MNKFSTCRKALLDNVNVALPRRIMSGTVESKVIKIWCIYFPIDYIFYLEQYIKSFFLCSLYIIDFYGINVLENT